MERCYKYFNEPAGLGDCQEAYKLLPKGPELITWNNRPDASDPYALPFQVNHGSCEIIFQTSGPAANQLNTFAFPGAAVRNLAGRVMDQCIEKPAAGKEQGGGYITRDLKHLLNAVTFPGTPFFEHPPSTSVFLTVLIWNRYGHAQKGNFAYNPGNQDLFLAEDIEEQLYRAQKRWPRGSALREELVKRQNAVAYSLPALEYVAKGTPNWYDFYPAPRAVCGDGESGGGVRRPGGSCGGGVRGDE
ncbi:MAG: hypothetical protein Q9169_004980 [Polycauliona sp. 2 TL-2023]